MNELLRFIGMLFSYYVAASLLYTAIEEHDPEWLIVSSMWVWIGLRVFPIFRKKSEDTNTDE